MPLLRLLRISSPIFTKLGKISIILLEKLWLPARLIFRFLHVHTRYQRPLFRMIQMLLDTMHFWDTILGIKFLCSGRFIRSERATYFWKKIGRLPLNTLSTNIEYFARTYRSRYGIGCVKIWLYRNVKL